EGMLPEGVARLLQRCLHPDPSERPRDMLEAAAVLEEAYQQETGRAYPRSYPRAAEVLAYGLNNRAVPLLDLGQRPEAEELWRQALQGEPHHPESAYNLALLRWREGSATDQDVQQELQRVEVAHAGDWLPPYLLAEFHLERGAAAEALEVVRKA